MKFHLLKCWPEPYEAMVQGWKTAEFRLDDRGYHLDDVLVLFEWIPSDERKPFDWGWKTGTLTGRNMMRKVRHIQRGFHMGDFVMMSLSSAVCLTSYDQAELAELVMTGALHHDRAERDAVQRARDQ